jgi:ferredoxin-nitrite reductase
MSAATKDISPDTVPEPFTAEQKEYLAGLLAGLAHRQLHEQASGSSPPDSASASSRDCGTTVPAIYGTPIADAAKQEVWKHEEHPLDSWDRVLAHAEAGKFPSEEDTFRFRYFGMFYVAPAQNSFMLRCRIPAGELTSAQLAGLAGIADDFGNGKAAITTRSNIQIREIAPQNLVNVLTRLQSLGLTSKGSGVDNVRNITASPTAGVDPQELIDTRPYAHALHHYILNSRDLYNLPRKFNVAFEGGGAVDTVADTNDIGFMAVKVAATEQGQSIAGGSTVAVEPGVYFRVELAGITGHKQLALDSGIVVQPFQCVSVAAAMIRVFVENGDRTNRKKARLKYLIDAWGMQKFINEVQRKLSFPLVRLSFDSCARRPPPVRHGHIGVYRQKQKGRNYVGVVIPVGIMSTKQMRRLAEMSANYGSRQVRLTPWQNLIVPDVPDGFVETVKRNLRRIGLHYDASSLTGGLVACTGSAGCKYAATDTKGHAVMIAERLQSRVQLDQPINIHFTGCPHSCAQHYVGDIGLQGVKVASGSVSGEGYNVVLGGGTGALAGIGREIFKGISFGEVPALLEHILKVYVAKRNGGESFLEFTRRHDLKQLQEVFSQ